jgi:hypothetical protein
MRTDPNADEVRGIVERVFAGFLQNRGAGVSPARNDGAGVSPASKKHGSRDGRTTARFPRLFEPSPPAPLPSTGEGRRAPRHCLPSTGEGSFATQHSCEELPDEIAETVIIDRGRYVARSYRTEGYLAMWLLAVGILQFYDDRGRMLATINLFESLRPQRMAA